MGTITIVVVGLYSQKTAGAICTGVRSTITIQRGTLTDYIHSLLYATSIYIRNIYIHLYTKLQHCQEQLHCSWQSLRKPSLTAGLHTVRSGILWFPYFTGSGGASSTEPLPSLISIVFTNHNLLPFLRPVSESHSPQGKLQPVLFHAIWYGIWLPGSGNSKLGMRNACPMILVTATTA